GPAAAGRGPYVGELDPVVGGRLEDGHRRPGGDVAVGAAGPGEHGGEEGGQRVAQRRAGRRQPARVAGADGGGQRRGGDPGGWRDRAPPRAAAAGGQRHGEELAAGSHPVTVVVAVLDVRADQVTPPGGVGGR